MEAGVHEGWCGGIWESLAGTERQVVVDMAVVVLGFPSLVLNPAVSYLWRKGVYLGSWFGASQCKAGGPPRSCCPVRLLHGSGRASQEAERLDPMRASVTSRLARSGF